MNIKVPVSQSVLGFELFKCTGPKNVGLMEV